MAELGVEPLYSGSSIHTFWGVLEYPALSGSAFLCAGPTVLKTLAIVAFGAWYLHFSYLPLMLFIMFINHLSYACIYSVILRHCLRPHPDLNSQYSDFFLLCSLVVTRNNNLCHVMSVLLVMISFRPLLWHVHAPSRHFLQQRSDAEVCL